jgi:hypothetical protein
LTPTTPKGLAAALLLARGRPEGMALLAPDMETALYSFRAALICLPAFLGLRLISWSVQGEPGNGIAIAVAAELVGYVLAWSGFALASKLLAEQAQRGGHWPHFIAAWNWSNLVQYLLLLVLMLPPLMGLPTWLGNALGLVALGYALWLEWFVTRVALGVAGPTAVMFVLLDLALGLFIGGITGRIAGS